MRTRLHPIAAAAIAWLFPLLADAQVRTDGSLGGPARALAGPTYAITEDLGRRAGNNLFHSFETFRVGSGETALFSTTTPTIANVFSRVTGGEVSVIDGTLRLQAAAGAPALFLINPAGVVFGAGAAIDVPGALHISTADSVRFPDGVFHADLARASTFSSAPPEAFGFLGERRGAVVLQGAQLSTGNAPLSIVAGDVTLTDVVVHSGGDVAVVAVGGQATHVPLSGVPSGPLQGTVRIEVGSLLQTEAPAATAGGTIQLAAGRIEMLDSAIWSVARGGGARAGGDILLRADDALVLTDTKINSWVAGADAVGGSIQVTAGRLAVDGGVIRSVIDRGRGGRGGDITLKVAGAAELRGGAEVFASLVSAPPYEEAETSDVRVLGKVEVNAGSLLIDGTSDAYTYTRIGSRDATNGDVDVRIAGDARIVGDGAYIAGSDALNIAAGSLALEKGGSIISRGKTDIAVRNTLRIAEGARITTDREHAQVQAQQILLDGGRLDADSGLSIDASDSIELRNGGTIFSSGSLTIAAGNLNVEGDGSYISASFWGAGEGETRVMVQNTLRIADGASIYTLYGPAQVQARQILLDGGELSHTGGFAGGSDLFVKASESMELRNGGSIVVNDSAALNLMAGRLLMDLGGIWGFGTHFQEAGGDIRIAVSGEAELRNDSIIRTQATNQTRSVYSDRAGNIVLRVGDLTLSDSVIASHVFFDKGNRAGDVDIAASGNVRLHGSSVTSKALISTDDVSSGAIRVRAGKALRLEDSDIGSLSSGAARAGDIALEAAEIDLATTPWTEASDAPEPSTLVTSFNYQSGAAGNISLRAAGPITMNGHSFILTGTRSSGGGRVEIEAASLSMAGSAETTPLINSYAFYGQAGDVVLKIADSITLRGGARVESYSEEGGNAGAVLIEAGSLLIQDGGSGVSASSYSGGQDGGNIAIRLAGDLQVRDGGSISSDSKGFGAAGSILIEAANVTVAGQSEEGDQSSISAGAFVEASGEMGGISIMAAERILVEEGGSISMANFALSPAAVSLSPRVLRMAAPRIELRHGAHVDTQSHVASGGDIQVDAERLILDQGSGIYTTGVRGDGGNIRIAGNLVLIQDSSLSTTSGDGNGGNISLAAPVLALNAGSVRANAGGTGATGGTILLNVGALLPSRQSLRLGGNDYTDSDNGANEIQAVAPWGISGNIEITAPKLDIAGALRGVNADTLPDAPLGKSPCQRTGGSSLALTGRGGLPPSSAEPAGMWPARPGDAAMVQTVGSAGCAGAR